MFVILGRKSEITEELRLSNVIFSQDFNIDMQHTLSFIELSLFYMANSSGPSTFALLSKNIPYTIVNFRAPDMNYSYSWFNPGTFLPWQNKELQRLIWKKDTSEVLIKEFDNLFGKVDKEKWKKELDLNKVDESILDWPHLVNKVLR